MKILILILKVTCKTLIHSLLTYFRIDFICDDSIAELLLMETIWQKELKMKKDKNHLPSSSNTIPSPTTTTTTTTTTIPMNEGKNEMPIMKEDSGNSNKDTSIVVALAKDLTPSSIITIAKRKQFEYRMQQQSLEEKVIEFSESDKEVLRQLPNKEYLIQDPRPLLLGLFDILFGYVYNYRSTLGEASVESGWTIVTLSSTLSWLQTFSSAKDTVVACLRRSLIFPLNRNYHYSLQIFHDTLSILKLGKRYL
jgi:hypothetical protein